MGHPETIVIVNWLPHAFCLLVAGLFLVVFLSLCTFKQSRKQKKEEKASILPPSPAEETFPKKLQQSPEEEKPANKPEYCSFNINDFRKTYKKPAHSYMETAIASESKKFAMETAVEKPQSVMATALHDPNLKTNKWAMSTAAERSAMVTAAEGGGMVTAAETGMMTAAEGGMTTATQRGMFTAAEPKYMRTAIVESKSKTPESGTTEDTTEDDEDEVAGKKKKKKPKQRRK